MPDAEDFIAAFLLASLALIGLILLAAWVVA